MTSAPGQQLALTPAQHRLCARIARLYYESELTQEQIGEVLGLSRMKVNRLLRLAREAGVVEIKVTGPEEPFGDLQHALLTMFRLQDVRIVPSPPDADGLRGVLAEGAARWLEEQLHDGLVVGIGLGRTVAELPETFAPDTRVGCVFITVEGVGTSPHAEFAAYDVASRLATKAGGVVEVISAPTFVSDPVMRDQLLAEPSIASSLDVARGAGLVIQSVGTISSDATLYRHGTLAEDDLARLRSAGAVGDALGHFFDEHGEPVPWPTDETHIGLTLDDLRQLKTSVVLAGGEEKAPIMRAAIRGGYFNVVVTDEDTARRLVEMGP